MGGGYLVHEGEARYIRGVSQARSIDDIAAIVIDERDGVPVTVRDVAKVSTAPMIRAGLATRDGQGEIVTGLVMMLIGQNGREVVERVKAEIEELKKSLPPGVTIEPLYDRTHLIDQTLSTVLHNLTAGGVLVMLVLLVLLGNLRGGLIVALAIPLSMLFAANVMLATGNLGQPDEPGRDRLRPDRRLERDHDRELRAAAGARGGNAAQARDRPRRGHRGAQAHDVRRADHRDRLPADPGASGDRGEAVPADGADGDLRAGRLAAPVAHADAGAGGDGALAAGRRRRKSGCSGGSSTSISRYSMPSSAIRWPRWCWRCRCVAASVPVALQSRAASSCRG